MNQSTIGRGWLELESDPGLFTLLVGDFGVNCIQVEEIYDLQKPIEGPVYGFIFLFKWIEERRARRKIITKEDSFVKDEEILNNMFFAQQVIPNSCATHALVSVLLNCDQIKLGDTLTELKNFSQIMSPEDKGYAIGNLPELARAHNSHARPEPHNLQEKQQGISTTKTMDAFHFVSYVPVNGRLYELDGLKQYPIDHGPVGEDWTERFRQVISGRLGMATGGEPYHDIRFNLMAVVPDRRQQLKHKLTTLKTNRQIVLEALQQMVKVTDNLSNDDSKTAIKDHTESMRLETAIGNDISKSPTKSNFEENTMDIDRIKGNKLESVDNGLQISISVEDGSEHIIPATLANTDITKPLAIHTRYNNNLIVSPTLSESTDTASEVASLLTSPSSTTDNSFRCTPEKCDGKINDMDSNSDKELTLEKAAQGLLDSTTRQIVEDAREKFNSHQGFTPKDLLALLKNVESEIASCESKLQDEVDKRRKYKADDCRRTHNYDHFISTFLSMLAEQGHLAGLIEQQMMSKRKTPSTNGSQTATSKTDPKKKKARAKKRR
ncbi:ubiquitin carboxyl-terminal hydrolase BAP1-like isoform X2 [Tubulanus polymorphus]|uniref:ubiquitin carboxyl-terminal hydrolase BAP1-like isoform X2 n=1 Tax=Tubulanus polymorphus TaxID=672921 RepID=UPI003DA33595